MAELERNEKMVTISRTDGSTYSSSDDDFSNKLPADTPINHAESQHQYSLELGSFPWRDVVVKKTDRSIAYFAKISEFKPNAPDIRLHAGGKDGPTVGAAHFRWSRSIRAGVGSNDLSMDWVEMKRGGTIRTKRFEFDYDGQGYSLRRSRDPEKGVKLLSYYQVVRESSGEVLGDYINETLLGWIKGSLTVADGISQELQILIILGVLSWREKARRRQTRAAAATGGASGGGG